MLFSLEGKTAQRTRFSARNSLLSTFLLESLCPSLDLSDYDNLSRQRLKTIKKSLIRQNEIIKAS